MPRNCCHVSLAFLIKVLNFLQSFIGVSIIIYSVWMLDQWHRIPDPVSPPSSDSVSFSIRQLTLFTDLLHVSALQLPAPWFIYSFMGVGIILCFITFIGCIAAESINGCCLCFYTILKIVFLLLEAALVAFIGIDHHWEKDLPFDPTGELENVRSFIEDNIDICKWVGITVVVIQALSLLLSMILRALISSRKNTYDDEDDFENSKGRTWEPLLNPSGQASGSGAKSDIWSSRMREKYGLNNSEKTA